MRLDIPDLRFGSGLWPSHLLELLLPSDGRRCSFDLSFALDTLTIDFPLQHRRYWSDTVHTMYVLPTSF
jgi:hypothetical protein